MCVDNGRKRKLAAIVEDVKEPELEDGELAPDCGVDIEKGSMSSSVTDEVQIVSSGGSHVSMDSVKGSSHVSNPKRRRLMDSKKGGTRREKRDSKEKRVSKEKKSEGKEKKGEGKDKKESQ